MIPRLNSSKKWTTFPGDFVDQIKEALLEHFGPQLRGAELIIEGRIYPEEILVRVGFLRKGELSQKNFEVSVTYKEDSALDQIHLAVDAAASIMNEYLDAENQEEGMELPRQWKEIDFGGQNIACQYSTVNSKLEGEADRLLGLTDESMVHSEDQDEDQEDVSDLPPTDKTKLH